MKQYVFSSTPATVLFFIVWLILIADFIFLLVDLKLISSMKSNYHSLYGVAYSDPLSGIPNRFSCDVLIEKYIDSKLPDGIGCIMIDFTNLPDINNSYSHTVGNLSLIHIFIMQDTLTITSVCMQKKKKKKNTPWENLIWPAILPMR